MGKNGFTLAEVLITLGIVGVVAALTLPTLIAKINDNIKKHKITVIESKFNRATDLLNIDNGIGPYYNSTKDFINSLSKHLKIIKVCDGENNAFSECFHYDKLTLRNNTAKTLSAFTNGTDLNKLNLTTNDYADTAAIVLADGTPMLLSYDLKCKAHDPDVAKGNNSDCITAIYDLNGSKKPNRIGKDILYLNSACVVELGGKCFSKAFKPEPISYEECMELADAGYGNVRGNCRQYSDADIDHRDGAVKHCGGNSKMVSTSDLINILGAEISKDNKINHELVKTIFGRDLPVGAWGDDKTWGRTNIVGFSPSMPYGHPTLYGKKNDSIYGICIEE